MSLERLNQLYNHLEKNRFKFLHADSEEVVGYMDNKINDYHEVIHWQVFRRDMSKKIDLYFAIMNDLGLYNRDINDIFECCVWYNETYTGIRLFFSKINSKTWESDLAEFINNLHDFESKLL